LDLASLYDPTPLLNGKRNMYGLINSLAKENRKKDDIKII